MFQKVKISFFTDCFVFYSILRFACNGDSRLESHRKCPCRPKLDVNSIGCPLKTVTHFQSHSLVRTFKSYCFLEKLQRFSRSSFVSRLIDLDVAFKGLVCGMIS